MTSPTVSITTPSDREIVITRHFQSPRARVWDAMTKPELVRRWCNGPDGWETSTCENDLRVGGSFRHAWRNRDGREMAMKGVYREVSPPQRLVRTEVFEMGCESRSQEMGGSLATLELVDLGPTTKLTVTLMFPSTQARDAMLASGMGKGVEAGYARVDELLRREW